MVVGIGSRKPGSAAKLRTVGHVENDYMKWSGYSKGQEGPLGRWGAGESEVSLVSGGTAIRSFGSAKAAYWNGVGE